MGILTSTVTYGEISTITLPPETTTINGQNITITMPVTTTLSPTTVTVTISNTTSSNSTASSDQAGYSLATTIFWLFSSMIILIPIRRKIRRKLMK